MVHIEVGHKLQQVLLPNPKKARPTLRKGASSRSNEVKQAARKPAHCQEVWEIEDSEPEIGSMAAAGEKPLDAAAVEKPSDTAAEEKASMPSAPLFAHRWCMLVSVLYAIEVLIVAVVVVLDVAAAIPISEVDDLAGSWQALQDADLL